MNTREKTLICDTRVRFSEEDHAELERIAKRDGTTLAAMVRKWALEGLRRDESIRKEFTDRGVMFSLQQDAP